MMLSNKPCSRLIFRILPSLSRAMPISSPAQTTPSLSSQIHLTFDFPRPCFVVHISKVPLLTRQIPSSAPIQMEPSLDMAILNIQPKGGFWLLLKAYRSEEHTSELQSLRHLV